MSSMFSILHCVSIVSGTLLRVRLKCVRVGRKYTVFGCNSSQYRSDSQESPKLAMETQRKTESIHDIYFRTDISGTFAIHRKDIRPDVNSP